MAVFDKIKNLLKRKRMQQRLDTVKNAYEEPETERESIKKATEIVLKLIEENPNMSAIELLKKIQEEDDLPNRILVETAKQLPEVRSEKAAVKAVEELDISSKGIQEILEHVDVSTDNAEKIAKQIPNEKIQEQEMKKIAEQRKLEREEKRRREEERKRQQTEAFKKQLRKTYINCDDKNTVTLASEFKRIRDENDSEELEKMMMQIFSRKAAIEIKHVGSAKIPTIVSVIPPEDLLQHNFSKLVEGEFESIKDKGKYPGEKEYSENILQEQILKEIAKNVAKNYEELGIIDIPQSEAMSQITNAQEIFFIDQLETYGCEIEDKEKVKRRIRGIKEYNENDLITMFRRMNEDEKEEYMEELKLQRRYGKQKKLPPKVEQEISKLHVMLEGLSEEDALDIIEEAKENIQEIKNEKNNEQKNGTTQSDDEESTR